MTSNPDFLVDTNMFGVFWELKTKQKSDEALKLEKWIKDLSYTPRFFVCPITIGEVEFGIRSASPPMSDEKRDGLRDVVNGFLIASVDKHVARESYALLRSKLYDYVGRPKEKKRPEQWKDPATSLELGIQENDLWIVATAMTYNLSLLTIDSMKSLKEVVRLNGLSVDFDDWQSG